jgi:quinol monooxygenase YgiN
MYVVTVEFNIHTEYREAFRQAMVLNARQSLQDEPGCRQFDVCASPDKPETVFLYELYDSREAFELHLKSAHFLQFNEQTQAWVQDKTIQTFTRVHP